MAWLKNILAVVDTSSAQHPELARSLKLCRATGAKLHVIDVVKDVNLTVRLFSRDYEHLHALLVKEKQAGLDQVKADCELAGVHATVEVVEGPSSQATYDAARRVHADLIVRSSKGPRSLSRGPIGSSAQRLLRRLPCPVWLVQAAQDAVPKMIVAAVDATPGDPAHGQLNRRIIGSALELARLESARVLIIYAWSLYSAELLSHRLPPNEYQVLMTANRQQQTESFERLLGEFDLASPNVESLLIEGEPSICIPAMCETKGADLLICGTVARHGIAGLLLGNTAERILNRVECSALALTPEDYTA